MSVQQRPSARQGHLHLIEPAPNLGHGPAWLAYLVDAFLPVTDQLTVSFPDTADYRPMIENKAAANTHLKKRPYAWRRGKQAWRASLDQAKQTGADLTMFSDIGLLLKRAQHDLRRDTGGPIWAIWFNPPPRHELSGWDLRRLFSRSARNRHREQQALRKPPAWLDAIWLLDASEAERISAGRHVKLELLPDPWPSTPTHDAGQARQRLNLPTDRCLFLHFGVAAQRKGLGDAIAAWHELDHSNQAVLVRVGPTNAEHMESLEPLCKQGHAIVRNERISDAEIDLYLRACDWILLPYRKHDGSSGLLAGAACAQRPVIASDYGVIGRRVKESNLGLVYPHLSVDGLRDAVREATNTPIKNFASGLSDYAQAHDFEHFAAALHAAWQKFLAEKTA